MWERKRICSSLLATVHIHWTSADRKELPGAHDDRSGWNRYRQNRLRTFVWPDASRGTPCVRVRGVRLMRVCVSARHLLYCMAARSAADEPYDSSSSNCAAAAAAAAAAAPVNVEGVARAVGGAPLLPASARPELVLAVGVRSSPDLRRAIAICAAAYARVTRGAGLGGATARRAPRCCCCCCCWATARRAATAVDKRAESPAERRWSAVSH